MQELPITHEYDSIADNRSVTAGAIEPPSRRRVSNIPVGVPNPHLPLDKNQNDHTFRKYSLSSYEHPYDITPPQYVYTGPFNSNPIPRNVSFRGTPDVQVYDPKDKSGTEEYGAHKRRGILSNMMDWYALDRSRTRQATSQNESMNRQGSTQSDDDYGYSSALRDMRRNDSMHSMISLGSDILDPDDPRVTGVKAKQLEDQDDLEKNALRQMDYRTRRKHLQRVRIEFNVSCTLVLFSFIPTFDNLSQSSNDQQTGISFEACTSLDDLRRPFT